MPMRYLRMYSEMQPVLEAQEAMRAVTVAAMGSGTMNERAQRKQIREWQEAAKIATRGSAPPKHMVSAMLGARGIKVD